MERFTLAPDLIFHSPTYGLLSFDEMIGRIVEFIKKEPDRSYKIIVGTDSASATHVSLVTAVTVWRRGRGGIFFWTRSEEKFYYTLQSRITAEALSSIMLGQEIRSRFKDILGDEFFWDGNEIHVDVGHNGPTREIVESIKGMIRGYNFEPVIKPDSFCASVVADRQT